MITAKAQAAAEQRGFCLPFDLAASGSSHIGGNVATNAGGTRFIRYGSLRHWIAGLTVVTGKGEVLRFNGRVLKNNTGYDLMALFIGQEGSLGIISEVVLRLAPAAAPRQCALLALTNTAAILKVLRCLQSQQEGLSLAAFEYWDKNSMRAVCTAQQLPLPFGATAANKQDEVSYALLEWESAAPEDALPLLQNLQDAGYAQEICLAQNSSQQQNFWRYRECISERSELL